MSYITAANSAALYLVVGAVLLFVALGCVYFIIKTYRAGIRIGMDKGALKKTITSSALFTVVPSISILLGVIALSGSLGVPTSWLRLSVVGNLSYEAIAAEAASQAMGTTLDSSVLTTENLVTILAVMTSGISAGIICTILFCKSYSKRCNKIMNKNTQSENKQSFSDWAMVSLFIGFCGTFIGSYIAEAARGISYIPLLTALVAAIIMKLCLVFEKKGFKWLENFALSISMLIAMASSILFTRIGG